MSEHEIIGTELANEVIDTQVVETNACNSASTGIKIAAGTLLTLGAWKAGELVVKGFRWIKKKVSAKKNAKANQAKDDDFPMPKVDEKSCFDD